MPDMPMYYQSYLLRHAMIFKKRPGWNRKVAMPLLADPATSLLNSSPSPPGKKKRKESGGDFAGSNPGPATKGAKEGERDENEKREGKKRERTQKEKK